MRVALVYDCLHPWTIGGAERWMRHLAVALVAAGHEVTYLTRLQWDPAEPPRIDGVEVVAVSRAEELYGPDGTRTIGEPLRFGQGVLRHLLAHGHRYDVVHTASFPYFSLLAAGAARRRGGFRVVADWHEVWSDAYWGAYVGGARGRLAAEVQRACARVPQRAFCFSELHARRLRDLGVRGPVEVLRGQWEGPLDRPEPLQAGPEVVFAGRLIPDKRAPDAVRAVVRASERVPGLRGAVFGDGPQASEVQAAIDALGARDRVRAPGFVGEDEVHDALRRAPCLLLPSGREGYGMVCVEAFALGVPVVLAPGPDNAAVEWIEDGVNGVVAAEATPEALADAVVRVHGLGHALRESTADWFAAHAPELGLGRSLERVLAAYAPSARR